MRREKYYYPEHAKGYERVLAEAKSAWAEIHGGTGFDRFASREFLEMALPGLDSVQARPRALEIGCGTGPAACFLAERGFDVDGIDLIPLAIDMARRIAQERGLSIRYLAMDVCELPHDGPKYDLVVDSYCLQGIVTDEDRERVYAAVHARLAPAGHYLVSTAMFDAARFCENEKVVNARGGVIYHRYGEDLYDPRTAIVYRQIEGSPDAFEDAMWIQGEWYLPNRRHRKATELRSELEAAGFQVLFQDADLGGNLICKSADR